MPDGSNITDELDRMLAAVELPDKLIKASQKPEGPREAGTCIPSNTVDVISAECESPVFFTKTDVNESYVVGPDVPAF